MSETKTEWYFIVNPRAGSGKTMSEWIPAESKLDALGIPYVTAMTDHKRHAITIAYDAASAGYRNIVAVGGDGSVHETLNGIMKYCDETGCDTSEFLLAVAPIGSGNDWVRSLGLPSEVSRMIDIIKAGKEGSMDIIRATSSKGRITYFANIAGIGFDSHVCARVNQEKESGKRSPSIYLQSLLKTIASLKKIRVRVCADGAEVFNGEAYSIALGNGKYSGGGMRQVPLARMDDGLLDYMVVPVLPAAFILRQVPKLFNGRINEVAQLVNGQCRKLEVTPLDTESADVFEEDGEIEGRIPVTFEVTGRTIRVLKA